MAKNQRRHKMRASGGSQGALALGLPVVECRSEVPSGGALPLLFDDPDPRALWVGRATLADHLRDAGMGWVLAVREFMRRRDWSAFEVAYKTGGRPPYHPAGMMSLVVFGTMFGQSSLRELETLARVDVRVWWLTGGVMPDHSVIGRFMNRHAALITEGFFEDVTRAVVKLLGQGDRTIAVDATVVQAASSRLKTIKQEAAREADAAAQAQAQAAPADAKLAAAAALAREVAETAERRSAERKVKARKNTDAPVSPHEPEAVVQPMKNGQFAPSYQACIAADRNRVIVGQKVESSSEPAAVAHLVEQAGRVMGTPVGTLLGDGRYNTGEIHKLAAKESFELLAPASSTDQSDRGGKEKKYFGKDRFTFDRETGCYTCPAGKLLTRQRASTDAAGRGIVDYIAKDCRDCPLRGQCVRGAGNRSVTRYEYEQAKEDLAAKMTESAVKKRYSRRQVMVEPVFAETKAIQRHVRFRRRRSRGVAMEHSLHCCAHNLRRALRVKLPWTRHDAKGCGRPQADRRDLRERLRSLVDTNRTSAPISGCPTCPRPRPSDTAWQQPVAKGYSRLG